MTPPFHIAVISTAYYARSHADVMMSRWLEPRAADESWGWPAPGPTRSKIVSLFVGPNLPHEDGHPHFNIGSAIAKDHGIPVFGSIAGALTLGGAELAVDGVLLIGEHGDYPSNDLGQKLYPRFEYWQETVDVMRAAGRTIPVFLDKHLSFDDAKATSIYRTSRASDIPLMAGSSLSHCPLLPGLTLTPDTAVTEAVTLFYGGEEAYGFHMLEVAESTLEKRRGGESGIRRIRAVAGTEFVAQLAADPRRRRLVTAVWNCGKAPESGLQTGEIAPIESLLAAAGVFEVEHLDGLRATHVLLRSEWQDFALAVSDEAGNIQASKVGCGGAENFYAHFATLNRRIEDFFLQGLVSAPLERTLLTTLTINALMAAAQQPGTWKETPQLALSYGPSNSETQSIR